MITILHTETSLNWSGQEIRIFEECLSLRDEGYTPLLAAPPESMIFQRMQEAGFIVFPLRYEWSKILSTLLALSSIIRTHDVSIINTHSSRDSWMAGLAARLFGCKVIRTRHLSNPVKPGLNTVVLYRWLADTVVTSCHETADLIANQSGQKRCFSIPAGVKQEEIEGQDGLAFREQFGLKEEDFVIGTLCVLRSWKGVNTFLDAAALCKKLPIKWLIVGDGPMRTFLEQQAQELDLSQVIFCGHIEPPYTYAALAAMDVFAMLSSANEGLSRSIVQAAALSKPLITTTVGGLKEVCLHGQTGFHAITADDVARYVQKLYKDQSLCNTLGKQARSLIHEFFTFDTTLSQMKKVYEEVLA